jgi:hypothetical protein
MKKQVEEPVSPTQPKLPTEEKVIQSQTDVTIVKN